ncbi:GNAT family N-acetyltransferase [uncultured Tessaracoccus sp.]|uniref:GNAT family N-acetyltransferase n=1 Tax=uncultured Tessaracoccus sp. TaxID=905023 RepID=UPI0025CFFC97|nr:GNAT family N-acetyltransferase [uncultured Tessaracoccus sp.]
MTVSLRPVREADADFLWTWLHATPDAQWKRWDAPYFPKGAPPSREEFERDHRRGLPDPHRRTIDVDGEPVGIVTRVEEAPAGGGWWELGILVLDPERWGSGIGTEALRQWSRVTFEETDAHVLTLQTWSGNERMLGAARRAGYAECGRVPGARQWDGRRWDSVRMCLVRPRPGAWDCRRDEPLPDDVARLLATVPEWFGLPEANQGYIDAARTLETWSVRDETGKVVGVTLVDRDFPVAADIHLTVVDRAHHGQGVGTAMIETIVAALRADGVRLLQVKTLGASHPDAGYARTRHFYERCGFLPLEETDLWGDDNPCLFMVRPL